jgi:hypothetical protein
VATESSLGRGIAHAFGAAGGALISGLSAGPLGPALATVSALAGAAAGLACSLVYRRYLGILGASAARRGTRERQAYENFRLGLSEENAAARLYARWLTRFLNWAERFFGDAGKANEGLFPRAFGLKAAAPLWTAPAFERCLLIALVYPVATIFIIWVASGHVGPAEAALLLPSNIGSWRRLIGALFVGIVLVLSNFLSDEIPNSSNTYPRRFNIDPYFYFFSWCYCHYRYWFQISNSILYYL